MMSNVVNHAKIDQVRSRSAKNSLDTPPQVIPSMQDKATAKMLAALAALQTMNSPGVKPDPVNENNPLTTSGFTPAQQRYLFVTQKLLQFGRPAAAANLTPHQAAVYSSSYKAGLDYARSHPGEAAADPRYPNTHPPGKHDSRSLPLIESDPNRKAAFDAMSTKEKQRVLYEADFYWAGVDAGATPS